MNAPTAIPSPKAVPPYKHTPLFPLGKDKTPYRKISSDGVRVETVLGKEMLVVTREALLDEVEAGGFQVLHQRTSLTPLRKLWIATRTQWRGR